MSIGKHLATRENITLVGSKSWKMGRPLIIDQGMKYYESHQKEVDQVINNIRYIGLDDSASAIDDALKGVVIHYYEKLFILTKSYEAVWIAKNRIETGEGVKRLQEEQQSGKAIFLAQSHFGASYLMAITLMTRNLNISMVGKFPEPVGSMIVDGSDRITEKYGTGKTTLINIADPAVDIPHEMFGALLGGKMLSNVFDENNEFCSPLSLMGKTVMGGSGMAQILRGFNDKKLTVATPFLIRTSDETFRFEIDFHTLSTENIIQDFFDSLGKRVKKYPDQWYFIHELHESMPEN
ncbi:hypothetical protein KAH37_08370 [bacterium]|nr:hypothetical protein [bacterium]